MHGSSQLLDSSAQLQRGSLCTVLSPPAWDPQPFPLCCSLARQGTVSGPTWTHPGGTGTSLKVLTSPQPVRISRAPGPSSLTSRLPAPLVHSPSPPGRSWSDGGAPFLPLRHRRPPRASRGEPPGFNSTVVAREEHHDQKTLSEQKGKHTRKSSKGSMPVHMFLTLSPTCLDL